MTVSKSTPAATAIRAGPHPVRAGAASRTLRLTGSSASCGRTGPRGWPAFSSTLNDSCVITSWAPVTHTAPQSRMMSWQPADNGEVTGPGTAISGRPWSRAWRAVLSAPRRLDHDGAAAERSNHSVADQETGAGGPAARRPLADGHSPHADVAEEPVVARRVVTIDPAGENGDRHAAGHYRHAVRAAVDAERPAGDDGPPLLGQRRGHLGAHVRAVGAHRPGAHDRHRAQARVAQVPAAPHPQ